MELNKFSLFTGLSSVQITKFEKAITRKKFLKNDEIIKEGDSGDSLIFLLDGEVKISKPLTLVTNTNDYDDREKELITLNSSFYPFFGDYSLFTEAEKLLETQPILVQQQLLVEAEARRS